jgi:hypothetical protein
LEDGLSLIIFGLILLELPLKIKDYFVLFCELLCGFLHQKVLLLHIHVVFDGDLAFPFFHRNRASIRLLIERGLKIGLKGLNLDGSFYKLCGIVQNLYLRWKLLRD